MTFKPNEVKKEVKHVDDSAVFDYSYGVVEIDHEVLDKIKALLRKGETYKYNKN